jgi:SAM-dependent methyltransferase
MIQNSGRNVMTSPIVRCPDCRRGAVRWQQPWRCDSCGRTYEGTETYLDLHPTGQQRTADHYSLQWGEELGFLQFLRDQRGAKQVMPAARLGWDALFAEIRDETGRRDVSVYDAACGFGGIADEIVNDATASRMTYVGADVHDALGGLPDRIPAIRRCGVFLRWDISEPLPVDGGFDYVLCRAAVHHTPDPRRTFKSLSAALKPGGIIAISVYRKKGICREALDDALRERIGPLSPQAAFDASREFTILGRALQEVDQQVTIPEGLTLLGIPAGKHSVHSLVYYHLLKCFYNPTFGDTYSTLVNYDWYHPEHAFRYDIEELRQWFEDEGLELLDAQSVEVQHFLKGQRPAS